MKSTGTLKRKGIRQLDLFALATGSLGSNKLRTALTVLGVTIGVFSVVGVMTTLTAVRRSIDSGLSFLGANVFEVGKYPAVMINDGWWNYRHRPNFALRDTSRFRSLMEANTDALVSLILEDGNERARYRDRQTGRNNSLIGTNENFIFTANYKIAYGRNLGPDDVLFNRPVVVIGNDIVNELFFDTNPLGKMVTIDGFRYTVVGVLEERGKIFGNSMDSLAVIPITRFMHTNYNSWRSTRISIQAPSAELFEETKQEAIGYLRLIRGLEPEAPNNFEIYSNDSLRSSFAQIAVTVGTGGLMISAIALVTAGVGIMNIMLVSVTERTREIGVRKSLGARSRDIMKQFLIESVFLSELGALGGIALGAIVGNLIAKQLNVMMIFPWFWAGVAVAVCSAIGIGFGLYPAWKAAKLNPVEALRYE